MNHTTEKDKESDKNRITKKGRVGSVDRVRVKGRVRGKDTITDRIRDTVSSGIRIRETVSNEIRIRDEELIRHWSECKSRIRVLESLDTKNVFVLRDGEIVTEERIGMLRRERERRVEMETRIVMKCGGGIRVV